MKFCPKSHRHGFPASGGASRVVPARWNSVAAGRSASPSGSRPLLRHVPPSAPGPAIRVPGNLRGPVSLPIPSRNGPGVFPRPGHPALARFPAERRSADRGAVARLGPRPPVHAEVQPGPVARRIAAGSSIHLDPATAFPGGNQPAVPRRSNIVSGPQAPGHDPGSAARLISFGRQRPRRNPPPSTSQVSTGLGRGKQPPWATAEVGPAAPPARRPPQPLPSFGRPVPPGRPRPRDETPAGPRPRASTSGPARWTASGGPGAGRGTYLSARGNQNLAGPAPGLIRLGWLIPVAGWYWAAWDRFSGRAQGTHGFRRRPKAPLA